LGTHDSGPRAGDIGYPKKSNKPPCQERFLQLGPSFEGIEFLSRTIMTGKPFYGNS
jgi:hypothetical protein